MSVVCAGYQKVPGSESHLEHHTDLKCQARDWHHTQKYFPRKSMASVQDFSENLVIEVKLEHQSKYYSQVGVTLYGKVCFFHIEDVKDSYISAKEKAQLIKMFDAESLNHIIAVTFCVVSDDLRHNPAFVQHVNDKVVLPYIKEHIMVPERDYFRSDGAPTQFDNATQYLWVSNSKQNTGVATDLTLHCTCHGNDKVDPEMGTAKTTVKSVLITETPENATEVRIYGYKGVAETLLKAGYETPKESLMKKKGRGIKRRHVMTVSAADVNQNITKGKTVDGSKVCRQFTCVNDPLSCRVRRRGCHECEGCMRLDPEDLANSGEQPCKRQKLCGKLPEIIQLEMDDTQSTTRVTRGKSAVESATQAEVLSRTADVGDMICASASGVPFIIGIVRTKATVAAADTTSIETGNVKAGALVLEVTKLEPILVSSMEMQVTDRKLTVPASTVKLVKMEAKVNEGNRAAIDSLEGVTKSSASSSIEENLERYFVRFKEKDRVTFSADTRTPPKNAELQNP